MLSKEKDGAFAVLCAQVKECLGSGHTIQERTFLDISRRIVKFLTSATAELLPSTFHELADYVFDYWKYEAERETDYKRGITHVRLYQLTYLVRLFGIIRQQDDQYRQDARTDEKYFQFLQVVDDSPGISQDDLVSRLKSNPSEVSEKIQYMEEKGYLLAQEILTNKYYQLSFDGMCLLNRMKENGVNNRKPDLIPWNITSVKQERIETANFFSSKPPFQYFITTEAPDQQKLSTSKRQSSPLRPSHQMVAGTEVRLHQTRIHGHKESVIKDRAALADMKVN